MGAPCFGPVVLRSSYLKSYLYSLCHTHQEGQQVLRTTECCKEKQCFKVFTNWETIRNLLMFGCSLSLSCPPPTPIYSPLAWSWEDQKEDSKVFGFFFVVVAVVVLAFILKELQIYRRWDDSSRRAGCHVTTEWWCKLWLPTWPILTPSRKGGGRVPHYCWVGMEAQHPTRLFGEGELLSLLRGNERASSPPGLLWGGMGDLEQGWKFRSPPWPLLTGVGMGPVFSPCCLAGVEYCLCSENYRRRL